MNMHIRQQLKNVTTIGFDKEVLADKYTIEMKEYSISERLVSLWLVLLLMTIS